MVIIYKLIDNTNDDCYIGSTVNLYNRKRYHRNMKDCSCKSIIENNNYHYIVLEECDESIRYEREQHHIDNTKNCVNKNRALGSDKNKIKEYQKQWYLDNKEEQDRKRKIYNENNGQKYKERRKLYYQKNKQAIIQKATKHTRERNKYSYSWGGDKRSSNNLLLIDVNLFL